MFRSFAIRVVPAIVGLSCFCATSRFSQGDEMELKLRYQTESSPGTGRFHGLTREVWNPSETAVIVCDVWDLHHSQNAVRRLEEFAPRLDEVLQEARSRERRSSTRRAIAWLPTRIIRRGSGPSTRRGPPNCPTTSSLVFAHSGRGASRLSLDQSDGGDDDDPEEHQAWAAKLEQLGRNPGSPWQRQSDLITIDAEADFISDRGDEVWSILEQRGIKNVILTGVHVNMCVLGRPFGLRQMARNGKNVVLMRDMTDTMYNPARWPYVSHFTGNDLIVSHIERFVCPTITSDQLIGGEAFRFRRHVRTSRS